VPVVSAFQVDRVGFRVLSRPFLDAFLHTCQEPDLQDFCHTLSNLPLDCKDVLQLPVIVLRPEVLIVSSIDKLGSDSQIVRGFSDTSLENASHSQLSSNLAKILTSTLVMHHRGPRYDSQFSDS